MMDSAPQAPFLHIARGDAGDLDCVMAVMTAAFSPEFGEAWTRSQCAGILPMTGVELTLARNGSGAPVAFALTRTVVGDSELLLLAVDPLHGRRGIGRRMLDSWLARAQDAGVTRAHLEVRDGNPAIAMYQAAGFALAGRRSNYYRGNDGRQFDALTMVRML